MLSPPIPVCRASNTTSQCDKICTYLYKGVVEATQRSLAIHLIPTSTPRLCELRRRLAADALFRNPALSPDTPLPAVTLADIAERLAKPDMQVNHSTDFDRLTALVSLLDTVVGDGSRLRAELDRADPNLGPDQTAALFDARIDAVARALKAMHDRINDNSLVSRKEAKAALDCVGKRLTYAVRTRPPAKTNVFDVLGGGDGDEDAGVPRQRDFMRRWTAMQKTEREKGEK